MSFICRAAQAHAVSSTVAVSPALVHLCKPTPTVTCKALYWTRPATRYYLQVQSGLTCTRWHLSHQLTPHPWFYTNATYTVTHISTVMGFLSSCVSGWVVFMKKHLNCRSPWTPAAVNDPVCSDQKLILFGHFLQAAKPLTSAEVYGSKVSTRLHMKWFCIANTAQPF